VYAALVEAHAEALISRFAPPVFGASSFFSEEQLRPLGGATADCGVDFGTFVLVADIVQHHLTVPTRSLCVPESFRSDMEKTVLKKVRQLHGTIDVLLDKVGHASHPLGRRPGRILPAVVQGADFPVNPVTVRYARNEAKNRGLLTQDGVMPLVIITLDELEELDALTTTMNVSVGDVVQGYVATGAENSLRNYIIETYGGSGLQRSTEMTAALERVTSAAVARLRVT
jgi:hypothetical protein